MTNQEKKAWLGRYIPVVLEIESLKEEKQRLYERAGIRSPSLSEVLSSVSGDDKIQSAVDGLVRLDRQINREYLQADELRLEIVRAIRSVPNDLRRQLLKYRFIDGLTFTEIAGKLNYSIRQTYRLYELALKDVIVWQSQNDV